MSKIQEKKIHRTQASTGVLTCVLCINEIGMSKGQEIKTQRTWTSTGVLARVLRVHGVSKGQEKKILTRHGEHRCARSCPARPRDVEEIRKRHTGHGRALVCSLVSCASTGYRRDKKKDTQDT